MRGSDQDVIIYDYLPHLAKTLFEDAYAMLGSGCWTNEVVLRQAGGKRFTRRLRIQLSGSPLEWGNWGEGETLSASERIPDGLLRCLLYGPHNWLSTESLVDFVRYVDARSAEQSLGALCKQAVENRSQPDGLSSNTPDTGPASLAAAGTSLDEKALKEFALLLKTIAVSHPRGGPPGNGMAFARELKRRLTRAGTRADRADRQIRELLFGTYLPGRGKNEITLAFFEEVVNFLRTATGQAYDSIPEEVLTQAVLGTERLVRASVEGLSKPERVLEQMRDVLLHIVYEGAVPALGHSPDYAKWLKAASLMDDLGYDARRVAALIGLADDDVRRRSTKAKSGLITGQREQRLARYLENGRSIRQAVPESFLAQHSLDPNIK